MLVLGLVSPANGDALVSLESSSQTVDPDGFLAPTLPIWRLSVDQYHEMLRCGILADDAPVELVEGVIIKKMNKNPPHVVATGKTRRAIEQVLPAGWHVDTQDPITTGDSEPEPDVRVARGAIDDYGNRHPGPADLAMLVEVADISLLRDRGEKKRAYARARIPVYWIVNLRARQIEVYSDPTGPTDVPDYRERRDYGEQEQVPLIIEGHEMARIPVANLLP